MTTQETIEGLWDQGTPISAKKKQRALCYRIVWCCRQDNQGKEIRTWL